MNNKYQNQKRSVNLHIEELVLHGFPASQRHQIARTLQQELTKLLSDGNIPASLMRGGIIPEIDGGTFQMRCGVTPGSIGEQVSQNIYGGLNR